MSPTPALTVEALRAAARLVYTQVPATPQYAWPQLCRRAGTEVWVKHENHTPTGAFKVRGGVTCIDALRRAQPGLKGIVSATRGNHGQSIARAAARAGLDTTIFVPEGNAREKNAAMQALGARLIVHGNDFDAAQVEARAYTAAHGLHWVPVFHAELVRGVATYALELFEAVPDLDTVYVPIGGGSGICGVIQARDALGLSTRVVGVVAAGAPTALLSARAGHPVGTDRIDTFADGLALREPIEEAFEIYSRGADRFVAVDDDAIAEAMRIYFSDTHNVAEAAGAAPLAALLQEGPAKAGQRAAVILCGGNVDREVFVEVLSGSTPRPAQH